MAKLMRRMSYEEFAEHLPEVLDALARADETVLVEKNGKTYSLELAQSRAHEVLPPLPNPEEVREALRKSAGALRGVDIDQLKADLRIQRQQDSSGRPG